MSRTVRHTITKPEYVRVVVNWNSVGTPIEKCVIQKWTSVLMTARIVVVLVPAIP